mmetsp:Transcript_9278/g.22815  ORF Transcript_9278/g.22815 Transcript_9278/m.22815 type:complete len:227 (+) Transcript_9278:618-1298(+)
MIEINLKGKPTDEYTVLIVIKKRTMESFPLFGSHIIYHLLMRRQRKISTDVPVVVLELTAIPRPIQTRIVEPAICIRCYPGKRWKDSICHPYAPWQSRSPSRVRVDSGDTSALVRCRHPATGLMSRERHARDRSLRDPLWVGLHRCGEPLLLEPLLLENLFRPFVIREVGRRGAVDLVFVDQRVDSVPGVLVLCRPGVRRPSVRISLPYSGLDEVHWGKVLLHRVA